MFHLSSHTEVHHDLNLLICKFFFRITQTKKKSCIICLDFSTFHSGSGGIKTSKIDFHISIFFLHVFIVYVPWTPKQFLVFRKIDFSGLWKKFYIRLPLFSPLCKILWIILTVSRGHDFDPIVFNQKNNFKFGIFQNHYEKKGIFFLQMCIFFTYFFINVKITANFSKNKSLSLWKSLSAASGSLVFNSWPLSDIYGNV